MKNRKAKEKEYNDKFSHIPIEYNERLEWMIDLYKLSPKQMDEIIYRKRNIEYNLEFYDLLIVLYEEPEGTPRPRFRIINKSNYMHAAISNPNFVHVYQPNAKDDFMYMNRLVDSELLELDRFVQTPCVITINSFFKTPEAYSISDKFIAEFGLDWQIKKPDWDNIGKKYSDMYNHNIWLDDNLVTSGTVNKFYSMLPRVEIHLKYLNYASNVQQYRCITNRKDYKQEYPIGYLDKLGNVIEGR